MLRVSVILGLLGLLLLVASFAPWGPGRVFNPDAQAPAPASQEALVAEGRALFLAKGCITCHRHDDAAPPSSTLEVGPELTHYEADEAFVRRWLRDPQAIRPATMMPNLELGDAEIEALIAFLSAS